MKNPLLLLIDADVIVYKAAAAAEKIICFEEEHCFPLCEMSDAIEAFEYKMYTILEHLDMPPAALTDGGVVFCFSDPDPGRSFRRAIWPQYKANRAGKPRPVALKYLREWVEETYPCQWYPTLEADDVLGILATSSGYAPEREKVIVSVDKDMKTLPCNFFDIGKGYDAEGSAIIQRIPEEDANYWFMTQTLTGDVTDGYPGCPKVGPATAAKIFRQMKEGKGEDTDLCDGKGSELSSLWQAVIEEYSKAGLGEDYALTMARLARILRAEDFDFKRRSVKLWTPPTL